MINLPDGMFLPVTIYNEPSQEVNEVLTALINYSMAQVNARMIAFDEPFELALANYLEEIQNEQVENPTIR